MLYEIIDPRMGHNTPLSLPQIPRNLRLATIAVEDANFYDNPGVDFIGIVRALWVTDIQGGEVLAGGSTVTQQLARMLMLDPDEEPAHHTTESSRVVAGMANRSSLYQRRCALSLSQRVLLRQPGVWYRSGRTRIPRQIRRRVRPCRMRLIGWFTAITCAIRSV